MMQSIRLRLLVWHAVAFAAGSAVLGGLLWLGIRHTLQTDLDHWLTAQSDGLERFLRLELRGTDDKAVAEEAREFSTGMPAGSGLALHDARNGLLFQHPRLPAGALAAVGAVPGRHSLNGKPVFAVSRQSHIQGRGYRIVIWRSLDETEASLRSLSFLILGLVPILLCIAIGGGWWLSRTALRPIDDMTLAAQQVSLDNLSSRLPLPRHEDELRRLAEAWNDMLARLEESSRRLTQFTADASHELRTPVAVIRSSAQVALRHERTHEEYRETLRDIEAQAAEMGTMLEALLGLARFDANRQRAAMAPVDLREVVERSVTQFVPSAGRKRVSLLMDLPSTPLIVAGDPGLLASLLSILLDNALKFTARSGNVSVKACRVDRGIAMEVRDDGCGIAEKDLPRVFDRFFQADPSRSGGGAGLGLALAKAIVQAHHGSIQAQSVQREGVIITVTLPAASPFNQDPAEPACAGVQSGRD